MKYLLSILCLFAFIFPNEYEDVIYLKDGSIIYGTIIEIKPNEYYKMESGGEIYVYLIDDIDIANKGKRSIKNQDISDKTWSFGIGTMTNKVTGFILVSKDFRLNNHSSVSISFGAPAYGLGYSYEQNYNNNGVFFSISLGQWYESNATQDFYSHHSMSGGYQFRNKRGKPNFWMVGLVFSYSDEVFTNWNNEFLYASPEIYLIPILSWERRF